MWATAKKFVQSMAFDGARDGYIFKLGPQGTGYYLDAQRQHEWLERIGNGSTS